MKKIVLTGPESTGKTTLTEALASHFGESVWVAETARNYIAQLQAVGQHYTQEDIIQIARIQLESEDKQAQFAKKYLFCDTDLITCKIWLEYKYGSCPEWINNIIAERPYHLHILCAIDIPWQYDPQREHPEQRADLYKIYCNVLHQYNKPFIEISGNLQQRLTQITTYIGK